jgi:hypothetical protein
MIPNPWEFPLEVRQTEALLKLPSFVRQVFREVDPAISEDDLDWLTTELDKQLRQFFAEGELTEGMG